VETLTAPEGSITVGWVGEGVLYARFQGDLYSSLGVAYAARLEQLLGDAKQVRSFVDASALKTYDLLARSAIVRVLLAHRSRFVSISLLNWDDASRQSAATPLTGLGDLLDVSRDPVEFHGRLLRAAPFASHRLNPRHEAAARPAAPTPRTR
jgi:hypothetical protein